MLDSLDIHPDRDEVLTMHIEYTEEKKVCLQERQQLEHINGPPSKKRKGNINLERNEEQGESSSHVTEENNSATAEIPIKSYKDHKLRKKWRKNSKKHVAREQGVNGSVSQTKLSESTNKIRVAIDCSFDSLMTQKEVKRVSSQIQYCYSLNGKMTQPLQLHLTHFKDKTLEQFDTAVDSYKSWDVVIKQETLTELYSVSEVVYLCVESENVIQMLDPDKVYVIAGFVGHGPHEGIVLDQAKEAGFNTARLPIQEYFRLGKQNWEHLYSISDVFKIISSFSTVDCWVEAIRSSIPRKMWVLRNNENAEGVEEEEMGLQRNEMRQQNITMPRIDRPLTKMSESTNKIRIAIDCSFDSFMFGKKIKTLCTLVQMCYSFNRRMPKPVQFYLTHFKDKTLKCFNDLFPLYKHWDIFIKPESLAELYSLSEIVYLCAESDNVIQTLDEDKIYVIGGFSADHSAHEGLVFDKAKEAGFNTARLPIQEYFTMTQGNILCINDVFKTLAKFSVSGCWTKAIRSNALKRKGLVEKVEINGAEEDFIPFS